MQLQRYCGHDNNMGRECKPTCRVQGVIPSSGRGEEAHRAITEMVNAGCSQAARALANLADALATAAAPHHSSLSSFKMSPQSDHSSLQSSQLVNPLERLSAISRSVWQKATQLSTEMRGEVNGGMTKASSKKSLLLASTSTSALPALPAASPSFCMHQPEVVSRKQAFMSPTPTKARPTWVKEPSETALALAEEIAEGAKVGWSGFIRPVDKTWAISSNFGPRWGRHHNGVDLAAPTGEPVLAADSGEVTFAGWEPSGYGYLVEITHKDGWKTLYAHTSEIFTWEGQFVRRGDCIASVGETGRATGPHLHWEIRNHKGSPVDPASYVEL